MATTPSKDDEILTKYAKKNKIDFITGSENDVLSRMIKAINFYDNKFDIILRANADCPLFMPTIQDIHLKNFIKSDKDLYSPFEEKKEPFGFSFCIFRNKTIFRIFVLKIKNILNFINLRELILNFQN